VLFSWDIWYPSIWFWIDFFSFHICDQRKEAKERRLIGTGFLSERLLKVVLYFITFVVCINLYVKI